MSVGLHLWYAALSAEVGIIIETDDPDRCKQKLYALRADAQDDSLEAISIVSSPADPTHLWLVKQCSVKKSDL